MYSRQHQLSDSQIIRIVLDEICKLKDVDSSWIEPDLNLVKELDFKPEEMNIMSQSLLKKMGVQDESEQFRDLMTPRDIVSKLKSFLSVEIPLFEAA